MKTSHSGDPKKTSLVQELGSLSIPKAALAAQKLHDMRSPLLQVVGLAKEKWDAIVKGHEKKHQAVGESREAAFWSVLAEPLEVIDLSLHPDLNRAFLEAANGKKEFSLPGGGEKKDAKFADSLRGLLGNKLDVEDRQVFIKVHGEEGKPSYWIGVGNPKAFPTPKPSTLQPPPPPPVGEKMSPTTERYWGLKFRVTW